MPHETPADVKASIKLAERLTQNGAKVHAHTYLPLPGTPWSHEPPGVITPDTRVMLDRLQQRGKVYGDWEAQESQAQELAAFDSYSNRRKAERVKAQPQ
jgi:radical SAM superfamily enzyme YgiQ (UPF0313 family)